MWHMRQVARGPREIASAMRQCQARNLLRGVSAASLSFAKLSRQAWLSSCCVGSPTLALKQLMLR